MGAPVRSRSDLINPILLGAPSFVAVDARNARALDARARWASSRARASAHARRLARRSMFAWLGLRLARDEKASRERRRARRRDDENGDVDAVNQNLCDELLINAPWSDAWCVF
jgi:hypothetical protein